MRTIVLGQNMAMVAIGDNEFYPCIGICETLESLPGEGDVSEEEQAHFDENGIAIIFTTQDSVLKFLETIQLMVEKFVDDRIQAEEDDAA